MLEGLYSTVGDRDSWMIVKTYHLITWWTEPRGSAPEPAPEGSVACGAPVREPPFWKLDYIIGSGALGTVFLEKVQTSGMEFPELWAVKRIPRTLPNFPSKRFQNEIKNLQALSNVCFAQQCVLSPWALVSFGMWEDCLTYGQYEWFVKFIASYEDAHCLHIAMEYISIGDMSKTFENGYLWNESDTKVVVEQLLHGLVVMHREGITHRDLKPEVCTLPCPKHCSQNLIVARMFSSASQRMRPSM